MLSKRKKWSKERPSSTSLHANLRPMWQNDNQLKFLPPPPLHRRHGQKRHCQIVVFFKMSIIKRQKKLDTRWNVVYYTPCPFRVEAFLHFKVKRTQNTIWGKCSSFTPFSISFFFSSVHYINDAEKWGYTNNKKVLLGTDEG